MAFENEFLSKYFHTTKVGSSIESNHGFLIRRKDGKVLPMVAQPNPIDLLRKHNVHSVFCSAMNRISQEKGLNHLTFEMSEIHISKRRYHLTDRGNLYFIVEGRARRYYYRLFYCSKIDRNTGDILGTPVITYFESTEIQSYCGDY